MRTSLTAAIFAFSLTLGSAPAPSAQAPPAADVRCYVEIQPADDADLAALSAALHQLGFQPAGVGEFAPNQRGPIRGRLPQKNVAAAAELAGVVRIAVGRTLAADPPPVAEYHVYLRYRIDADLQERYAIFRRMLKRLSDAGFVRSERDPPLAGDDWRYGTLLDGKAPAAAAARLRDDPQVRSVLLIPAGYDLPEMPLVELELENFGGRQREAVEKLLDHLEQLGFVESAGYDHRRYRRLVGRMPKQRAAAIHTEAFDMELPLTADRDPRRTPGRIRVPVVVYFDGRKSTEEITRALTPFGFELRPGGKETPGKGGHVLGRLPTRSLEAAGQLDGVNRVVPEYAKAVETVTAIRQAQVLREPAGQEPAAVPPPPPIPGDQQHLHKLSVELRRQLPRFIADSPRTPIRVEIVLAAATAAGDDNDWRDKLAEADVALSLDGRIGPMLSGMIPAADIPRLAALPLVSTVRLPQEARPPVMSRFNPEKPAETGLAFIRLNRPTEQAKPLAEFLRKREKHRVAVIDADFRGWWPLVGKGLPKNTHLLDLTAELNPELLPAAMAEDVGIPGTGTRLALAVATLTPIDEMLLVRIDPALPYQVQTTAQAISGQAAVSLALFRRELELDRARQELERRRKELRVERKLVMDNYRSDEDARKARAEYRKKQEQFDADERALAARQRRFLDLLADLRRLSGVETVLLGRRWTDGQPSLPGERGGMRWLDVGSLNNAVWVQAVETLDVQAWTGLFRDTEGDHAMEFIDASAARRDRPDLNFLAWQPLPDASGKAGGKIVAQELPPGALVQVMLTWREIHAPEWKRAAADDVYRPGIAPLHLVVLRQRDPAGQWLPTDTFQLLDRTQSWPDRVENHPRYAVYQQTLRFRVPRESGRYAVRVEGRQPDSTLPEQAHPLPNPERWELRPKLIVEVIDEVHRPQGRVIWQNFATGE